MLWTIYILPPRVLTMIYEFMEDVYNRVSRVGLLGFLEYHHASRFILFAYDIEFFE